MELATRLEKENEVQSRLTSGLLPLAISDRSANWFAKGSGEFSASPTKTAVPDADIAAAKAAGKVWVNLETGVYHKSGRWYGRTKNGRFMTEAEAKKAGYRESKRQ